MIQKIKEILIGKPLTNEELHGEKLNVFWGLPIMASDAISSVAYAVEEMLWVLIAVIGLASYKYMFLTAIAIVVLLLILVFSYRQTIDSYPHGGGSYTVAKENIGETSGLIAASSLIIDYILTVAVSTSAGTAAITSALPALLPYSVIITIALIAFMTIINLRGVKESARMFAFPTYIFIASMLVMIIVGIVKVYILGITPEAVSEIPAITGDITFFLIIKTFAAGCAGLSGVEAVSNAVPNFSDPSQKNAKKVLALLALFVLLIFGGTSFMASIYHAVPKYDTTVLSGISSQIFGTGFMYYLIQASTAVILIMAANTSYAGLPMLLSLVAKDGYAPRQFTVRGGRLSYSNGIIALSIAAGALVIIYKGQTHDLIPLYSIGVFISFSMSQLGMLVKWIKSKGPGRIHKLIINGLGSLMTILAVLVIAYSKFSHGAWISIVLIVIFVILMRITKRHYKELSHQLALNPDEVKNETEHIDVAKHMIVLIGSLSKASLKAINYAKGLSNNTNVTAFNVSTDMEQAEKLKAKWEECGIDIPLVIKYSPYREVINPLIQYIESEEHESNPEDMITVVVPQFVVNKSWKNIYHNQTGYTIRRKLLRDRHIAVITVPYVLDK